MNLRKITLAVTALASLAAANVATAQQSVAIVGDDITFRGCIRRVDFQGTAPPSMLVWSQNGIMLAAVTAMGAGVPNPIGTSGMQGRVFYWLDDHDDEKLANHVGQMVEVTGDLKHFEEGEVKIDRDDGITEIEVKMDGHKEKARMPTAWLGLGAVGDQEYDIVTRRVDVDKVFVLGACNAQ